MIEELVDEDLEFLKKLDKKLHHKLPFESMVYGKGLSDHYTHKKMSGKELKKVLGLTNKRDYAIAPCNTAMGFKAGFIVYRMDNDLPGMPLEAKPILMFVEEQLPKGYDWGKMSRIYMDQRNRELLKLAELDEPKENVGNYDY